VEQDEILIFKCRFHYDDWNYSPIFAILL
jgi:hypothetical protein